MSVPGGPAQLRALLALRWQMTRGTGPRVGLGLAALLVGWLVWACLRIAGALDPVVLETAARLAPEAFLGFGALALIAPLAAAGGAEVVPSEQLVAFPVRPAALFLGGLVLAPLNLVWVVQLLVLAVETSCLTAGGRLLPGVLTTAAYVACVTLLGQAVAWTVVGVRRTRRGRWAVLGLSGALVAAALAVGQTGLAHRWVERTPTSFVARAELAGGAGELRPWLTGTLALTATALVVLLVGLRACAWALARVGDEGAHRTGRAVRRRPARRTVLRELLALDRASVWRAPALRRGGLVLTLLPAAALAGAEVPWASLAVLPGLVAAGSGLLFGINAFALDGSGALWLASLPVDPSLLARAKAVVLTETVLSAVAITVATGTVRAPQGPSAAELTAVLASAVACTAVVVSTGLRLSVRSPHRADLRGPRDAIAPPGALALASVRLAAPAGLTGLALAAAGGTGRWWLPLLVALPVLLLCGRSLHGSLRRWADPVSRGRVVAAVATG